MSLPPLVKYESVSEYKRHYQRQYQRNRIVTFDGIRIYFQPQRFNHAFYENSNKQKGAKDRFSFERAERIDWIKETLNNPSAKLFQGWNQYNKTYEPARRVSVVYDDFVVIVEFRLNLQSQLKGEFVTCYVADKSIDKIKSSPLWSRQQCLNCLKK